MSVRGGCARLARDRGTVTAELAIGMTAVVSMLALLAGVVDVAQTQLRAGDAAAAGARAAARGESEAEVLRLTLRLAGAAASADVTHDADLVAVNVRVPVALPLPGGPRVVVRGRASTPAEPHEGLP